MDLSRRGYIEFSPIKSFMQQFNDVLRVTDLTPGYIDTNHAADVVCVMGVSSQFDEVDAGSPTPFYSMAVIGDGQGSIDSIEFLPLKATH